MNTKHILPAAILAFAGASSFAATLGNELTEQPQAQSTLTRAQVQADTRAALANGTVERNAYDEQVGVVTDRQHAASTTSRAEVRADTRAFFAAHPNAQYELRTYGLGS